MTSKTSPYSTGFNGHAKVCDCLKCARTRASNLFGAWEANGKVAELSPSKLIFVRSHFRAGKCLTRKPNTAKFMRRLLRSAMWDQRKRAVK